MTRPTILVTGATGTTGSEVVRQLSARGIAARGLTRNPARAPALDHIAFVKGDLGDPASLDAAFAGIEAVYLNVVPGPGALDQVDNAIAAARTAGVRRIVKLSGLLASPDSPSAIIRMHNEADARARASGLGATVLRANSFFQNIAAQLPGIRQQGMFYLPLADSRQSLIDAADIAAVAIEALTSDRHVGKDHDLTGAASLSLHDVAAELAEASGKPVTYVPISNAAFAQSLIDSGMPAGAAADVAELFAVFASGVYAEPTGDVAAILGRAPRAFADYARTLFAGP